MKVGVRDCLCSWTDACPLDPPGRSGLDYKKGIVSRGSENQDRPFAGE
jgi:hypothetical protein